MSARLIIATRGSDLALWQSRWVAAQLATRGLTTELLIVRTEGDAKPDVDLAEGTDRGVFVREIETALLDGRARIAVHSLKDLPTTPTAGLSIAAIPERADAADLLLVRPEAVVNGGVLPLASGARVLCELKYLNSFPPLKTFFSSSS